MRPVVITGMGIVSSLGNNVGEVTAALRESRSGIEYSPAAAAAGLSSHVCGGIRLDPAKHIDRKLYRFMSPASAYCYLAALEAIEGAGLAERDLRSERTGLIMGSGGASTSQVMEAVDAQRDRGLRGVGPFRVPRTMGSAINACLTTTFGITGINYSITSACATSAHCIGHAAEQVACGRQDIVLAGGGEEVHWTLSVLFDAMRALSRRYNDRPEKASRTYDKDRDGFVISGGGGVVVVEALEHAERRKAPILAEIAGYGATSDGADMVAPSGEGAERCMRQALTTCKGPVGYINTHGTSTPLGDLIELEAIRRVFGDEMPALGSTKPLSGHALGGAGVHEAIYALIMQRERFLTPSANIETLDPGAEGYPIVRQRLDDVDLPYVMSNSFGFGGTNACLVLGQAG